MAGLPPVGERTLRAVYERVLAASPDEIAQVDEGGAVTFAESYLRSLRVAAGIGAHGIGHQEPVALLLDNSLDAVHVWSGTGLGGRVEVPVNTAYKGRFLTHVLNDCGAEAAPAPGDGGELMAYMYTSGTTGVSKGVLISHAHAYTYAPRPDDADNPLQVAVMAPLASDVRGFCRRFGLQAAAVYGMSEIGAVLDGPPDTIVGGEAGFARPGYELRLVDTDGRDVEPGQIGELWVKPEDPRMVMLGYHNLPEKTAETLVDGWVHTGDAFRADAEKRFFFADRMKDALRRRGENISSFEVERVINEYPAVFESAVVGVPSALSEDEIKAVIVPRDGQRIDPVELTAFLIDRLPYFMVPRYLKFADGLPKTPTQKVHKHLLREGGTGPQTWDREAAGIVLRRGSR